MRESIIDIFKIAIGGVLATFSILFLNYTFKIINKNKAKISTFMEWCGKYLVKVPQMYIVPFLFILLILISSKYNLFEKQMLIILSCVFGVLINLAYKWVENVDEIK